MAASRPTMTESVANYIRHREPHISREDALASATHAISEIIEVLRQWGEDQAAAVLKENRHR